MGKVRCPTSGDCIEVERSRADKVGDTWSCPDCKADIVLDGKRKPVHKPHVLRRSRAELSRMVRREIKSYIHEQADPRLDDFVQNHMRSMGKLIKKALKHTLPDLLIGVDNAWRWGARKFGANTPAARPTPRMCWLKPS